MPEEIEIPTEHLHEAIHKEAESTSERWVMKVALTAALLAVFAAVSALLAGYHANEAMVEHIRASDQWAYYQAKGIKAVVLITKSDLLRAMDKEPKEQDEGSIKRYAEEQKGIEEKARESAQAASKHLSAHNQLAMAVAILQVAIALAAISALTKRRWLWYGSMCFGSIGIVVFALGVSY
jgi:hypothetical protein